MFVDPEFRFRATLVDSLALQEFLPRAVVSLSVARGQMLIDQLSITVKSKRLADLVIAIVDKVAEKEGKSDHFGPFGAVFALVNQPDPTTDTEKNSPRSATILFAGRFPGSCGDELVNEDSLEIARSLSEKIDAELSARGVQFVQWAQDPTQNSADHADDTSKTSNSIERNRGSVSTLQDRWSRSLGFEKLATLCYMRCDLPELSEENARGGVVGSLQLSPIHHQDADKLRFECLVERTYVATLDCPSLSSFQTTSMTLDGYRANPTFAPDLWFEVKLPPPASTVVGCLVLARHRTEAAEDSSIDIESSLPESTPENRCGAIEVVYMGIVPEHRGEGFGRQLVQATFDVARRERCPTVVLAVDTLNSPARSAYGAAGFLPILFEDVWGKRIVGVKTEASKNEST